MSSSAARTGTPQLMISNAQAHNQLTTRDSIKGNPLSQGPSFGEASFTPFSARLHSTLKQDGINTRRHVHQATGIDCDHKQYIHIPP